MSVASRVGKMFGKSKAELNEIAKGKGSKAADAADELDRRQYNKDVKSGLESGPYASKIEYTGDSSANEDALYKKQQQAKASTLTKKEEAAADKEAYASAMGKEKPAAKKGKLTTKEKEELQKSLGLKKGGMVKKPMAYAKGGMVKANCGASMKPAQKGKK